MIKCIYSFFLIVLCGNYKIIPNDNNSCHNFKWRGSVMANTLGSYPNTSGSSPDFATRWLVYLSYTYTRNSIVKTMLVTGYPICNDDLEYNH